MHELSIVQSIVDTAEREAKKHRAKSVESIDIVIGELSGIENLSLDFAWSVAVKNTVLQHARCNIIYVEGKGRCSDCGREFHMQQFYDACPDCGQYLIQVLEGRELQIRSIVLNRN